MSSCIPALGINYDNPLTITCQFQPVAMIWPFQHLSISLAFADWPECRDTVQNGRGPAGGGPTEGRSWKISPLAPGPLLLLLHPVSQQQSPSVSALPLAALSDWHQQHCLWKHEELTGLLFMTDLYCNIYIYSYHLAAFFPKQLYFTAQWSE